MNTFITSIATATPPFRISQEEAFGFMTKMYGMKQEEAARLRRLYRATGIQCRYTVIPDFMTGNNSFMPGNENHYPTTGDRLQLFQKEDINLCTEASQRALSGMSPQKVTHLITVSCTGMYAPGIDVELVDRLGLNHSVERTGIHFMGCYAAFNAVKIADAICTAHDDAVVLIVCVELCTIHVQKERLEDYLLANALFGDGAAAIVMRSKPVAGINLKISSFHNELHRNGHSDMAWKIGDFGFEMRLSSYVPGIIESGVANMVGKLMAKVESGHVDYYAIHPGGKKFFR